MSKIIVQACLMMTIIFSQSVKADGVDPIQGFYCTPTDVTVYFGSRLHIKCSGSMTTGFYDEIRIYYFSVSTDNPDDVAYALEMATNAITSGKRLMLTVRTGYSYNPSGCGQNNCRRIDGISLLRN